MHGQRRVGALVCAVAALGAGGTASAASLPDFSRGPGVARGVLGGQWKAIAKAYEQGGERTTESEGDNQTLVNAHGSYQGAKWEFSLTLQRPAAAFTLSPGIPGFDALSPSSLGLSFPTGAGWRFRIAGGIKARAKVRVGGTTVFSWSPGLHYSMSLPRIKLTGGLTLDASDPTRPAVTGRRLGASGRIDLGGILGGLHPNFKFGQVDGAPALIGGAKGNIGLPGLGARFDGTVSLSFLPTRSPDFSDALTGTASAAATSLGQKLGLGSDWVVVRLRLDGKLSFKLAHVARRDAHAAIQFAWPLPSQRDLNNFLLILAGLSNFSLPRHWGDNPPPAYRTPPPPPGVDYGGTAVDLEDHILPHIPNGLVHSIIGPGSRNAYAAEADAAISSGEYLAAEAFRSSTTHDPRALQRLNDVLDGIDRLFWVTEDAAASGHQIVANPYTPGTLARTATLAPPLRPIQVVRAPHGKVKILVPKRLSGRAAALPSTAISYADGSLASRGCYYLRPEGGWTVTSGRTTRHAATYADAVRRSGSLVRGRVGTAKITPRGRVWQGLGCGDASPVSRDQYTGVFFGLGLTYKLVDDAAVRVHVRTLVDKALGYLQRNSWRILVPFENAGTCTQSVSTATIQCDLAKAKVRNLGSENFFFSFDDQASFRRVGATVDPGRWLSDYETAAPLLATPAWAGIYLTTLDPLFQYYKFNLAHEVLGSLLFLENGDALRQLYLPAFDVLRGATRAHQNAFFDLLTILVQPDALRGDVASEPSANNPQISLADEIRSLLAEWVTRRNESPGPNHTPYLNLAEPDYVLGLWPDNIGLYTTLDFDPKCLSRWALPPQARKGQHHDNLWEAEPFGVGITARNCNSTVRPTQAGLQRSSSSGIYPSNREAPGVDYLLPYWMAVYLGIVPKPA